MNPVFGCFIKKSCDTRKSAKNSAAIFRFFTCFYAAFGHSNLHLFETYHYHSSCNPKWIASKPSLCELYELEWWINLVYYVNLIWYVVVIFDRAKQSFKPWLTYIYGCYSIVTGKLMQWWITHNTAYTTTWPFDHMAEQQAMCMIESHRVSTALQVLLGYMSVFNLKHLYCQAKTYFNVLNFPSKQSTSARTSHIPWNRC